MWIIVGITGFYLIYRLEFRWYMVSVIKMGLNPMGVPMILLNPRAHYLIHGIAVGLFCFSTFCFYEMNHWLVLLAPVAVLVAWAVHGLKQSTLRDRVIVLAASIAVAQKRNGASRTQINDAICLATLGSGYDIGSDYDLKVLMKGMILPTLGLLPTFSSLVAGGDFDSPVVRRYHSDCKDIDTKIDDAYQRETRLQQATH
jgi:hypothetical protein